MTVAIEAGIPGPRKTEENDPADDGVESRNSITKRPKEPGSFLRVSPDVFEVFALLADRKASRSPQEVSKSALSTPQEYVGFQTIPPLVFEVFVSMSETRGKAPRRSKHPRTQVGTEAEHAERVRRLEAMQGWQRGPHAKKI